MQTPIPIRARQNLTKLALFTLSTDGELKDLTLALDEEIFGVYRNSGDVPTRSIVVTSAGIHIRHTAHPSEQIEGTQDQSTNQSANQPAQQSFAPFTDQTTSQSFEPLAEQSEDQSFAPSTEPPTDISTVRSQDQSFDPVTDQSASHFTYVAYGAIKDMYWHTWDRKDLQDPQNRRLIVELKSGQRLDLYVVGARNNALDLSSFHNFLLAAVQTRQLENRRVIRHPL
jgi:hypothetical protein